MIAEEMAGKVMYTWFDERFQKPVNKSVIVNLPSMARMSRWFTSLKGMTF